MLSTRCEGHTAPLIRNIDVSPSLGREIDLAGLDRVASIYAFVIIGRTSPAVEGKLESRFIPRAVRFKEATGRLINDVKL